MRVAVTGTPGTGKTTATELLDAELEVVHLNEMIVQEGLVKGPDPDLDTLVADMRAVEDRVRELNDVVIESHLAHHFAADRVIVLRCHPEVLTRRLRERGAGEAKIQENVDSEALDLILAEAVERHGEDRVYEIDTTDREPEDVAAEIDAVIAGQRDPRVGTVSFVDHL